MLNRETVYKYYKTCTKCYDDDDGDDDDDTLSLGGEK